MDALTRVKTAGQLGNLLSAYIPLLARTGNPYATLRAQIQDAVVPPQSAAAKTLYIVASAGAALDVLLILSVWLVRWRKNSFWLVRRARAQSDTYLLAHTSLLWTCFTVVMCLAMQGFAWCMYRLAERKALNMTVYWTTLPWLPGLVAIVVNCWVLATTYVLHVRSYAVGRDRKLYSPAVVQGGAAATALVLIATSVPLAIKAGNAYADAMDNWRRADAALGAAASRFSGSLSDAAAVSATIAPTLFDLIERKKKLDFWFRWTFTSFSIWSFLLGAIFCAIGVAYVRALKRSLDEFRDRSPTASNVFASTLRNLVLLLAGFTGFLVIVATNSIWVAALSKDVLSKGNVMELSAVVPLLAVIVGTLVIALVMLYQALTAPTIFSSSSSASRPAHFLRSRTGSQRAARGELSVHYQRFAIAASEYLPDSPILSLTDEHSGTTGPFENLELQPADDASSLKSNAAYGRGGTTDGIAVVRQAVTVVSLPKEELLDDRDEKY